MVMQIAAYSFHIRSGGCVVFKDYEYIGFYNTYAEALEQIFGE